MKGDLRYPRIQRTSVPGYDLHMSQETILQDEVLVNFESDVRLAHGPGSEAVGNVGFEAVAAPWSLKGECSFGVPFWGIW